PLVLHRLNGGLEARLVRRGRVDAGLLQRFLVVVEEQRVGVQGDTVAVVLVDAGLPDLGVEVALLELEQLSHRVQGDDDAPGGVGGQLVDVHDGDVGAVAGLHRGRDLGIEVGPLQHVHADLDVLVLAVELVDQLAHERAVAAGEAVPEGQADVGPGVVLALAELVAPAATTAGARRGTAPATAGGQQHAGRRAGPYSEEGPPAPGPLVGAVLAHFPTF